MAEQPSSCHFCGAEIVPEAFQKGRAVRILGQQYCETCMAEAIQKSKEEGFVPDFRTPRPNEPPSPLTRKRALDPKPPKPDPS